MLMNSTKNIWRPKRMDKEKFKEYLQQMADWYVTLSDDEKKEVFQIIEEVEQKLENEGE